jgi:hypothetical protein
VSSRNRVISNELARCRPKEKRCFHGEEADTPCEADFTDVMAFLNHTRARVYSIPAVPNHKVAISFRAFRRDAAMNGEIAIVCCENKRSERRSAWARPQPASAQLPGATRIAAHRALYEPNACRDDAIRIMGASSGWLSLGFGPP